MAGTLRDVAGLSPGHRAAAIRAAIVRAEPWLAILLAFHAVTLLFDDTPSIGLRVAGAVVGLAGIVGLFRQQRWTWALARGLGASTLVCLMSVEAGDHFNSYMPWFTMIGISYAFVLGAKRSIPVVIFNVVALAVAGTRALGFAEMFIRIPPLLIGALIAGLVGEALTQSITEAADAQRDADLAKYREKQLRTVIDSAPLGIMLLDDRRRGESFANARVTEFTQTDDPYLGEGSLRHLIHIDDQHLYNELRDEVLAGRTVRRTMRVLHASRGPRMTSLIAAPVLDESGSLLSAIVISQDVHDDILAQKQLERFKAIADATSDLVLIFSGRGHTRYMNPAAKEFFGEIEDVPQAYDQFVPPEFRQAIDVELRAAVIADGIWQDEVELFDKAGQRRPVSAVAVAIYNERGQVTASALTFRDLTERKQLESKLAYDAGHDTLTGLPNRQMLLSILSSTIAANEPIAVLFCDLDDFKIVNDGLGHGVGDRVLRTVADRLARGARGGDIVGRLGGDEFLVICRGVASPAEVGAVAKRLASSVGEPISLEGRDLIVGMSIGAALSAEGVAADELVQQADMAMYAAKHSGDRRPTMFDPSMRQRADDRLELERDLRVALDNRELEVHYQSVVRTSDQSVLGFEALVRWNHKTRGMLLPAAFIPVANQAGLARTLGNFVLDEATTALRTMRLVNPTLTMSINLSSWQLSDERLVDKIAKALARNGLPASALTIEITEEVVMADLHAAQPKLDELHHLGVRMAIDDFGTGYSNLSLLREFAADYVKIDRSLISALGTDASGAHLVQLILSLTRELGFAPVAEGVETVEQLNALRALDCQIAQGYLFSTPLTFADALAILRFPDPTKNAQEASRTMP